jgi:hypothetical protein
VCIVEFLSTIALVMIWVPADSKCWRWQGPGLIDALLLVSGGAALWICIIAVLWKYIAEQISAYLRTEEGQRGSFGFFLFYPFSYIRFRMNSALFSAVGFYGFCCRSHDHDHPGVWAIIADEVHSSREGA